MMERPTPQRTNGAAATSAKPTQSATSSPNRYVQKVRQDTQQYVQDLLGENEKLRRMVTGLESETAVLNREKKRLEIQIEAVRKLVDCDRREHEELRQRLIDVEGQNRTFSERYVEVEKQNNDLANLYVAGYRLHGSLDRGEVLAAIQEIIINLVGCEELGVFELFSGDPVGGDYRMVTSFGLDEELSEKLDPRQGLLAEAARRGEPLLAERFDPSVLGPGEEHLTAAVPLKVDGRVVGVIAIFRLLPQKTGGLEALDHELFDLLSQQAGVALYSTTLHASAISRPLPPAATSGLTGTLSAS